MNETQDKLTITPETRIGKLLDCYPQLEEVLLQMSPAFAKLRNPLLRRTVAKVATLQQVAKIGDVSLVTLVNTLREAVGQGTVTDLKQETAQPGEAPAWFRKEAVVESLDVTPLIEAGEHPLERVVSRVRQLQPGEIFELIAGFVPEPLLDIVRKQGFVVWTTRDENARYRNYIAKPSTGATFDV